MAVEGAVKKLHVALEQVMKQMSREEARHSEKMGKLQEERASLHKALDALGVKR